MKLNSQTCSQNDEAVRVVAVESLIARWMKNRDGDIFVDQQTVSFLQQTNGNLLALDHIAQLANRSLIEVEERLRQHDRADRNRAE